MKSTTWGRILTVTALLLLVGGTAFAQLQSGNLYAKVADEQGAALPGVTVTLSGQGAPQVQVTNAQGEVRFLGLSPGTYALEAQLEGFSTLNYPSVTLNVGRNTSLELTLSAAVEDVITVTAESPLLDQKRISTGSTVSSTELEKIPTARDPWAILQSTPGVLTDRINVGGNESGQQSQYVGLGSGGDQAIWSLDGVTITDMSATGSSPGYYDFDAFEEMQVTTGGGDASTATGGVVLNMVTKRGTNEWRGSGRYLLSDKDNQSDLSISSSEFGKAGPWNNNTAQARFLTGNRIVKVEDWGAELGGPIVKDRLWVWGSYAKPEIDLRTIPVLPNAPDGFQDLSTLEDWNAKVNAQISANNSATAFAWQSDKVKIGRNASLTRPQETTWNQSKFGPSPTAYKVEDTHIFSSNFYLTGLYSVVNGGFQLVPQGGDVPPYLNGATWANSFFLIQIERPQEQYKADASSFFNTGSLSHELKYGASYRTVDQTTLSRTQGDGYEVDLGGGTSLWAYSRNGFIDVKADYTSAFLQDTFTVGNLTANVGVRYDKQGGDNRGVTIAGNPVTTAILPTVNYAGGPAGFEWETIVPRLGLTYAVGAERKTLLRASYSQYADQLATGFVGWLNPAALQSYAYYYGPTRGIGNTRLPRLNELFYFGYTSSNVNPTNGQLIQSNQVDPNLDAPLTDELLFSVEHALLPEFVVGLNFTYRQITDLIEQERLVFDCPTAADCSATGANLNSTGRAHRRSDYVKRAATANRNIALPDGTTFPLEVWELRSGVSTRGGFLLENGDREQEYKGVSFTFNKRLANRWMTRGNISWSDWTWKSPDSENEDPTRAINNGAGGQAIIDGDIVVQGSGTGSGAKGNVFINSTWSYSLNALYQVAPDRPWGFNVAGNLTGREGYPIQYFRRVSGGGTVAPARNTKDGAFGIQVPLTANQESYRFDDIRILDLRVEKEFSFKDFGFTLGADVFNATNEATVLQRQGRLQIGTGDHVTEVVSPRIIRLGVKFNFR